MQKRKIAFEDIYDLFAIRVILDVPLEQEKAACWQVYSIVTDHYQPNPKRLRDWINSPRSNGYESLHTTVMSIPGQWVEVQIRTKRMDEIAEKGYAAHWKYKENTASRVSELDRWLNKVRETLEQTSATTGVEFVNEFRPNLFNEEVYVFTPNGDLKMLPAGATALDFAFDIHTDIGRQCIGAKVNHKLEPISYQVKNGDQIEILTSARQTPNEGWLKIAVTSKAISKIRESLREGKKEVAKDGATLLEKRFKKLGISYDDENLNALRGFLDEKTQLDLLYKFGNSSYGNAEIQKFVKAREQRNTGRNENIKDNKSFKKEIKALHGGKSDSLLIGEDMKEIDYRMAVCCQPIPGDEVFGFVTLSEGIKIHRTKCPNAVELMSNYGYRIVKAKWTSQKELAFLTGLQVDGTDRIGLVNDVTEMISRELKVNMKSISMDTEDGVFHGKIELYVNHTSHLDQLIKNLKKVPGIISISRFDS